MARVNKNKVDTVTINAHGSRSDYFERNVEDFISASQEVKILNLSFTWFDTNGRDVIRKNIEKGTRFEVLIIKRKRQNEDVSYLTQRQKDEMKSELTIGYNTMLFRLFQFFLDEAIANANNPDKLNSLFNRLL